MPIISSGVETEMAVRYQIGMTAEGSPPKLRPLWN